MTTQVSRASAILDMVPGLGQQRRADEHPGSVVRHVFFHGGDMPDLAEKLVSANVEAYLSYFSRPCHNYSPTVFQRRHRQYVRRPITAWRLRAGFQCYRAACRKTSTIFSSCTKKLQMPVLAAGRFFHGRHYLGVADSGGKRQGRRLNAADISSLKEKPEFVIQQALAFFELLRK
jgi:hypothetical protein